MMNVPSQALLRSTMALCFVLRLLFFPLIHLCKTSLLKGLRYPLASKNAIYSITWVYLFYNTISLQKLVAECWSSSAAGQPLSELKCKLQVTCIPREIRNNRRFHASVMADVLQQYIPEASPWVLLAVVTGPPAKCPRAKHPRQALRPQPPPSDMLSMPFSCNSLHSVLLPPKGRGKGKAFGDLNMGMINPIMSGRKVS